MGKTLINDLDSLASSDGLGIFEDIFKDLVDRVTSDGKNEENIISKTNGLTDDNEDT